MEINGKFTVFARLNWRIDQALGTFEQTPVVHSVIINDRINQLIYFCV